MNDLRRILLWLATICFLAIAIWGLQWDERSNAQPFAPPYREFRLTHRVGFLGWTFYVPLRRMFYGWSAVLCATAGLWPLATGERSKRCLGRWERSAGGRAARKET